IIPVVGCNCQPTSRLAATLRPRSGDLRRRGPRGAGDRPGARTLRAPLRVAAKQRAYPMLVVMQSRATDPEIERVVEVIRAQGLTPHVLPGATRTAIGVTGNTGAVDKALFEVLPGVEEAIRVTKPY